tara:strand:+ start:630 stop:953 length:324 start_codon:yes stop_codon:yes gene_type:complete
MKKKLLIILLFIIIFLIIIILFPISESQSQVGKKIFINKGKCAACHTLSDARSYSKIGPNLDYRKPSKSRVLMTVMEGAGAMPSLEGTLSKEEMEAVSEYVYQATKE